jgi:hypothetical protein
MTKFICDDYEYLNLYIVGITVVLDFVHRPEL